MGNVDKKQTYIAYDENNEPFECVKVFSGKVNDDKPEWMKEIEATMKINDEYEEINYEFLNGKSVDAHELVSHLVAKIRESNYDDVPSHYLSSVINFVFSHAQKPINQ